MDFRRFYCEIKYKNHNILLYDGRSTHNSKYYSYQFIIISNNQDVIILISEGDVDIILLFFFFYYKPYEKGLFKKWPTKNDWLLIII